MKSRDFVYWLQGFLEVSGAIELNAEQTKVVKNHLNMVFKHEIDPSMPDPTGELQKMHLGYESDALIRC